MKRYRLLGVLAAAMLLLAGCQQDGTVNQQAEELQEARESTEPAEDQSEVTKKDDEIKRHRVEINIKDYGTITAELDASYAPETVDNFLELAESGFYDGLTFHRIIKDFMMQGGEGIDENAKKIKGEFEKNGVENPNSHTRGALSMARTMDMDSASSQFFIVHQDSTFLDGEYAVFGYVTDGMDIVDDICENTPVTDGNGTVEAENQPVIESVKILK